MRSIDTAAKVLIGALLVAGAMGAAGPAPGQESEAPAANSKPTRVSADAADGDAAEPAAVEKEKGGIGRAILLWPVNRLLDLVDIGRANVTVGPGMGLTAHATKLVQLGAGAFTGARIGWQQRHFPIRFQAKAEAGISAAYAETGEKRGWFYMGLSFHLALVGAEVGIDLGEVADFATGLFFLDPMDDDL